MFESWSAHFNEVKEAVERFEKMEYSGQEFFFDVHTIENIFDFYLDKLQYNKAERIIGIGVKQHPDASTLQVKQAIIFIEKGRLAKASALLENLLLIEKSNPEVYLNLGYVYLRDGQNERAKKIFEEGLKFAFNEEQEVLLDVVLYLNQFKEYSATIDILGIRYEQIKENENLLFEMAYALDKVGEDQMAFNVYQDVLDINPFSDNAWYNTGICYVKLGNLDKANEAFDFCLALDPDHTQALFNKGNSLAQQNKYREALDSYLECVSYDLQQSKCLHYIADCWNQLGNSTDAIKFYELAVDTDFMDFNTWESYSLLHLENMDPEACRKIIDRAMTEKEIMSDDELSSFFHIRAQSYILDEEWDLSKKFFKKAALSQRKDLRHLIALFKLNQALNPEYNLELFIEEFSGDFLETVSFQYFLAAYHILITENMENGIHFLDEAVSNAPWNLKDLTDLFPEVKEIAKKHHQLSELLRVNSEDED
ncbi:tetratricopeptide repeat protein [Marinilabilia sp.]|jgi:tetratricopeptide (TPR) repeat protein